MSLGTTSRRKARGAGRPLHNLATGVLVALLSACGGDGSAPGQLDDAQRDTVDDIDPDAVRDDFLVGGDRPAEVFVPRSYDPREPTPLLLFLHGYGYSGDWYEDALHIKDEASARGFLYSFPTGSVDPDGKPFWNAAAACCDFYGSGVDDSAWLRALIDEIKETVNVDHQRVFVMGHSNGAFMANRLACEHADAIAGVVSISGMVTSSCQPSEPVAVVQVHGTADGTVSFNGGYLAAPHMSATESVELWAALDGCNLRPRDEESRLDIDNSVAGAETKVTVYDDGCSPGGHAELWTVQGAGHVLAPSADFIPGVVDFLYAHPKAE
jgi:polyhydroxybutyrate depolymerase